MLQEAIYKFQVMAPLLLPEVIDNALAEDVTIYEDYALLPYALPKPVTIESLMDMFEDKMELIMLYHIVPTEATDFGQACCAYSNPSSERMFKINARTNSEGVISDLIVSIYDSLECMSTDVLADVKLNENHGNFIYRRDVGEIVNDFS